MRASRVPSREEDARRAWWIIGTIAAVSLLFGIGSLVILPRLGEEPVETLRPAPSGALVWHVEGRVTDTALKPVEGVCVAVGPNGCQRLNPRTDADGKWFIDFPQVAVPYDLHFIRQSYRELIVRVNLDGPRQVNVVMEPIR